MCDWMPMSGHVVFLFTVLIEPERTEIRASPDLSQGCPQDAKQGRKRPDEKRSHEDGDIFVVGNQMFRLVPANLCRRELEWESC